MFDTVGTTDSVEAGIVTEVVSPNHPCPLCGKETAVSHDLGWRSCKSCKAPIFVSLTQEEITALEQRVKDAEFRAERAEAALKLEKAYVRTVSAQIWEMGRRPAPR